jgi:leucine dehydrogenase
LNLDEPTVRMRPMIPSSSSSKPLDLALELGHERVIVVQERSVGLRAVVAIHDSTLGPAIGGTRMRAYPRFDDAVADALRLARAMTLKAVYAGLPHGGAKAVVDAEPTRADRRELLAAFARATRELAGRFVSAGDFGVDLDDVHFMAGISPVYGRPAGGDAPDIAEMTALGVYAGLTVVARRLGRGLEGLHVALQGVGGVGGRLAVRLAAAGARLAIADTDRRRAERLAAETGAELVAPEAILETPCHVLSPNAIGGVLTVETIAGLRCEAVCGAANVPLADEALADALARRGILFAPDFVVSAGGILTLLFERGELDLAGTVTRVERIGVDLAELFAAAELERLPPYRLAVRRVEERLAAARAGRR